MAESKSSPKVDAAVIGYLIKAAEADTAYRDLYLRRAAERLESSLPRAEYERLKEQPATLDQLMQETRAGGVAAKLDKGAGTHGARLRHAERAQG